MRQNSIGDILILNAGGDVYRCIAMAENLDIAVEKLLRTGHCDMTLNCGANVSIRDSIRVFTAFFRSNKPSLPVIGHTLQWVIRPVGWIKRES